MYGSIDLECVTNFQEVSYMSIRVFTLEPIKLYKLLSHLNNVRLDFKIIDCNNQSIMLDSTPVKDGLAYLDMVLYGSTMFYDCTSNSTPHSSTLYLILALRFRKVIHSNSRSPANNSDRLLLVINQQI